MLSIADIEELLGKDADTLLTHECRGIVKDQLNLPGPDWVDRVIAYSDRPVPVLRSLQTLLNQGRLGGTGYLSILPVDQGIEHSAGASFAANPLYFDPENIIKLALESGCNAVASTLGGLGLLARRWHRSDQRSQSFPAANPCQRHRNLPHDPGCIFVSGSDDCLRALLS